MKLSFTDSGNKQERFVRPIDCWEDTYEGYLLHLLDFDEGLRTVIEKLYNELNSHSVDTTIMNISKLLRSRYTCYGMCWSRLEDSDAMWRIYSYGNRGIQLISSKERLGRIIEEFGIAGKSYEISDVKYDIKSSEDAVKRILVKNAKLNSAFFHKRPAFSHEEEVRAIINYVDNHKLIESFSASAIRTNYGFEDENTYSVSERIQNAVSKSKVQDYYQNTAATELFISINNIKEYIEGVRIHPLAEKWYVDLIIKLCKQNGLVCYGQSDLYKDIND